MIVEKGYGPVDYKMHVEYVEFYPADKLKHMVSTSTENGRNVSLPTPPSLARALWFIIAISLAVHVGCLVVGNTILTNWRCPHHPVHTAVEFSGGLIALWVAWLLMSLEQRRAGTSYNVAIAGALIGMGMLDGFHALVHAGQAFVWLHSTATFVGGVLFALVWLPPDWGRRAAGWWPWAVCCGATVFGCWSLACPDTTPAMLVANEQGIKEFSFWAQSLNVAGGVLLFLAAVRLMRTYFQDGNIDDLLFCLHCALFGSAAVMFEQSELWDLPWWGWHLLRLMAYGVALWFIVRTEQREQRALVVMAGELQEFNAVLENRVAERTETLAQQNTALGQLEQRFRATIDAAPTAMVMIDQSGQIVLVNAETEKLFGYARDELLGQRVEILVPERFRVEHPDHRTGYFKDPTARPMGKGRDLFGLRKDGSEIPVELGLNPVHTDEGVFVLSAILDITERTQLTESLRQSNVELEQFAYVASHDLQEPLRKVSSFCELLADEYGDKLDGDAVQYMHYVIDGAERMRALIQDLLKFSRIGSDGCEDADTSAREALSDALLNLESSVEEAAAEVTHDELPVVRADRRQLTQLLQNLVGNAIKYRGDASPKIHVGVDSVDGHWVFSVTDNGIGIEPRCHERVFGIFKRLHGRSEYSGTGIGLAICRRIVDRLGGRIWVESELGAGSSFRFTIKKSHSIRNHDEPAHSATH